MLCANCGAVNADDAKFCAACNQPVSDVWRAPQGELVTASAGVGQLDYGSFWQRLAAVIVDGFTVIGIQMVFSAAAGLAVFAADIVVGGALLGDRPHWIKVVLSIVLAIAQTLVIVSYFVLMESSEDGATLGKRALNLRVVDNAGNRVSKQRALGRFLAHFLSVLTLLIGYLMQPFTPRKQALHDIVAGTLVVRTGKSGDRRARVIIIVTVLVIAASVGAAAWFLLALIGAANSRD